MTGAGAGAGPGLGPAPAPTLCGRPVPVDRPLVMAIVNRTPDSFYDRGATFTDTAAMARVDEVVAAGADVLDIGGVKAGPGDPVDAAEETRRVVPFVEAVRARHPGVVISIDTWRGEVARRALAAGADLVNDTWAGHDPGVLTAAGEARAGFVCSHTGGAVPRTRPFRVGYADVVRDVVDELSAAADRALAAGVPPDGILVDPTHDFGKNTFHGLELLRRMDEIVAVGHPVLMALSNKDFIGETLDAGVDDRAEGTLAATSVAAYLGARVFRTHDVPGTLRALEMVSSIVGTRRPARTVRGLA
ncbi:dihydropteroate synthase [Dietzia kunjamensis subsp. schimae]|uniref:Dihydropteroate synthase n=1 Tax=Dietzia kunjamensis subsp. schimae TaxID=498198 RepID=A0ABY1MXY2_9ACTN|nr:dihydropteroate synthase [Dietzia kunjamensis]SMO38907.1 dihydropteroate synthase [Dietzia kunjamensis subsp. schimae]